MGILRNHNTGLYISSNYCIFFLQQQYIFIYQALLEHHLYGDTEVEASEVNGHIDELNQRMPGNVTGMEHEFKVS